MSEEDLLGLAERVTARARPGEHVEAYVARGVSTQVKAYGGEVEALTSAEKMLNCSGWDFGTPGIPGEWTRPGMNSPSRLGSSLPPT